MQTRTPESVRNAPHVSEVIKKIQIAISTLILMILHQLPVLAQSQNLVIDRGIMGVTQAINRLPLVTRVMFIAAHPDDENSGVLPFFSRGLHAKTALLTLTRGEGGQNLIGPDLFDALGLIRTGELLAAGEYYGVEQFFTRAYDFGFSKSADEAFQKWGKEEVLSDMVRAIRQFKPQIIVSVWRGEPSDGHGHHQACGLLAREAFLGAADASRFPELLQAGLEPWKVERFYCPAKAGETRVAVVDPGRHSFLLGSSYQEIASIGYSFHRSQGMGDSYSPPGSRPFSYHLVYPEGTDAVSPEFPAPRLIDLDRLLHRSDGLASELKSRLRVIDASITKAKADLQPEDFSATVQSLISGLAGLQDLQRWLIASSSSNGLKGLLFLLKEKELDFQHALELSTGVHFEARCSHPDLVPGQQFEVVVSLLNRWNEQLGIRRVVLIAPLGWTIQSAMAIPPVLAPQEHVELKYKGVVPDQQSPSKPPWARRNKSQSLYSVSDKSLTNSSAIPLPLFAQLDYAVRGTPAQVRTPVETLRGDNLRGVRKSPVLILPQVNLEVSPSPQLVSIRSTRVTRELGLKVTNNSPTPQTGTVSIVGPKGWIVEQPAVSFSLHRTGEAVNLQFRAHAGQALETGRSEFKITADVDGERLNEAYKVYSVLNLWRLPLYEPAVAEIVSFDYQLPENLKLAYVMGAGDRVPDALSRLGIAVTMLETNHLSSGELGKYDCIIVGVRGYEVRDDLIANNARLLEYVRNGGVLLVQYHRQTGWNKGQYAPYPAKIRSEEDRVTDETAPVKILHPEHSLFNYPNKITQKDFEHWIQERGLYFIQERDARYQSFLSTGDPGQPPLDGGLLLAEYGKGKYILTSYSWFRQLPESIPGALRIFINLISQNPRFLTSRARVSN